MKKIYLILTILFISTNIIAQNIDGNGKALVGKWMSVKKDFEVEVMEGENGIFSSKIIWFEVLPGEVMEEMEDTKNPNANLKTRKRLGMTALTGLKYISNNNWTGGSLYDPNSGHTYNSKIKMTTPNTITLRGFLGISLIGSTIKFTRVE